MEPTDQRDQVGGAAKCVWGQSGVWWTWPGVGEEPQGRWAGQSQEAEAKRWWLFRGCLRDWQVTWTGYCPQRGQHPDKHGPAGWDAGVQPELKGAAQLWGQSGAMCSVPLEV